LYPTWNRRVDFQRGGVVLAEADTFFVMAEAAPIDTERLRWEKLDCSPTGPCLFGAKHRIMSRTQRWEASRVFPEIVSKPMTHDDFAAALPNIVEFTLDMIEVAASKATDSIADCKQIACGVPLALLGYGGGRFDNVAARKAIHTQLARGVDGEGWPVDHFTFDLASAEWPSQSNAMMVTRSMAPFWVHPAPGHFRTSLPSPNRPYISRHFSFGVRLCAVPVMFQALSERGVMGKYSDGKIIGSALERKRQLFGVSYLSKKVMGALKQSLGTGPGQRLYLTIEDTRTTPPAQTRQELTSLQHNEIQGLLAHMLNLWYAPCATCGPAGQTHAKKNKNRGQLLGRTPTVCMASIMSTPASKWLHENRVQVCSEMDSHALTSYPDTGRDLATSIFGWDVPEVGSFYDAIGASSPRKAGRMWCRQVFESARILQQATWDEEQRCEDHPVASPVVTRAHYANIEAQFVWYERSQPVTAEYVGRADRPPMPLAVYEDRFPAAVITTSDNTPAWYDAQAFFHRRTDRNLPLKPRQNRVEEHTRFWLMKAEFARLINEHEACNPDETKFARLGNGNAVRPPGEQYTPMLPRHIGRPEIR